ncbi:MAG: hypothetical protein V4706_12890 [Pseudomonadota bacterium]
MIALTVLADGVVSRSEIGALFGSQTYEQLEIDTTEMQGLVEALALDLSQLGTPAWTHGGELQPLLVIRVLEGVTAPALSLKTFELCKLIAESDFHVCQSERALLRRARSHWLLPIPTTITPKGY